MKTLIAIISIIVVGGGAYYLFAHQQTSPSPATESTATQKTEAVEQTGSSPEPSTLPTGSQSTNTALDTDLSAIDTQLSGLGADTAKSKASLTDQPIVQSSL